MEASDNFINEKKIARSVNIVSHKNNLGKCMAMLTGVKAAKNNIVCVIDGMGKILHMKLKEWLTIGTRFPKIGKTLC